MINGSCTNKNCSNRADKAAAPAKTNKVGRTRTVKAAAVEKPAAKNAKVSRASKCITYHISELPVNEQPK